MRTACVTLVVLVGTAVGDEPKKLAHDFEAAKVSDVPKGWTIARTGTGQGSVWAVVEDKTAPKGSKVLAQTGASPASVFNLCVLDDAAFADVEVSVAFKATEGKTDRGGGVVWRYIDANNYYVARFNPLEENLRLYHVVAGKRTQIGGMEQLKLKADEWHTLKVCMVGEGITCSLDETAEIVTCDTTLSKPGKVGLWTKADARTYFDDFTAKEAK